MQITIFWKGKTHSRTVEKAQQYSDYNRLYVVTSKNRDRYFYFRKDDVQPKDYGWRIVLGASLPEDVVSLFAMELETIHQSALL